MTDPVRFDTHDLIFGYHVINSAILNQLNVNCIAFSPFQSILKCEYCNHHCCVSLRVKYSIYTFCLMLIAAAVFWGNIYTVSVKHLV